ncbi:MAG: hypothetical protein GC160_01865 [Acidobacteria bacterium]|nr:hypothetical protein [Acidobacteriota bacterium]
MFNKLHVRHWALPAAALLLAPLALTAADTGVSTEIRNQIEVAHHEAEALRHSADNLAMLARTPLKYSKVAHATELHRSLSRLADLQATVKSLTAIEAKATPAERGEIDHLKADLRPVVVDAHKALRTFHDNGVNGLYAPDYQNSVRGLYEGAKALVAETAVPVAAAAD